MRGKLTRTIRVQVTTTWTVEGRPAMIDYAHPEALVSTASLAERLNGPNARIVEVIWGDSPGFGRPAYERGHIPGALAWDFEQDLQTPGSPGDVADATTMASLLSRSGIGPNTSIAVYSALNNLLATFAFWLLKVYGHGPVSLLDGDKQKWLNEGRPTSEEVPAIVPAHYPIPALDPTLRARFADVIACLGEPNTRLVDARSAEMYTGQDTAGMARGGHIPGAVNLAAQRELRSDGSFVAWQVPTVNADGSFRPAEELRALFRNLGITSDTDIVTYCVRGGLSTHAWFVLTQLLGYPNVREYDRSWAEWGNRNELPIN